jgi:inosine-uridine nucleoside N-ribohydrolase
VEDAGRSDRDPGHDDAIALPSVHDLCAVARVIDPGVMTTRRAPITVELTGTHTRGMTVADLRWPRPRSATRRSPWTWTTPGSGTSSSTR